MNNRNIGDLIPLIGTTLGGFAIGVIARNGFLGWTGETFIAGLLGLAGGAFALLAAKNTAMRNEAKAAVRFANGVDTAKIAIVSGVSHAREFINVSEEPTTAPAATTTVRNTILNELPTPTEHTPVGIQVIYDKLTMLTRRYLDPSDPSIMRVNNTEGLKWLSAVEYEVIRLDEACRQLKDSSSSRFNDL